MVSLADGLAVRQTQAVHDGIVDLYRQLDFLIAHPKGSDYPAQPGEPASDAERAILKTLSQKTTLDFQETPLNEVLQFITDTYGLRVWIDEMACDDEGIDRDTPVTLDIADIALGAALRVLLDSMQLTYVIDDEVLLVTTAIAEEEMVEARVYDVRKLLDMREPDYDSLIEMITTTVEPDSS